MAYQINNKKTVYTSPILSLEQVNITFPDNHARQYDCVKLQNAVTILPVDASGNVLFVKQYRIGSESELLELPAGKIEAGEAPEVCAAREIREETGMAAHILQPLGQFFMSPGYSSEFMFAFVATGLYLSPLTPDADEFLNVVKMPLPNVIEQITRGEVIDGKTLAVFMLAMPFFAENSWI